MRGHPIKSVMTVLVTYNRKELLAESLRRVLLSLRSCDRVVVVDNASTDGTRELVAKCASQDARVLYERLEQNLGGAGGFAAGFRLALNSEVDAIWAMDDDCFVEPDTLTRLMADFDDHVVSNPLVADVADPTFLAFELRAPGGALLARTEDVRSLVTFDDAAFFLGTLIPTRIAADIGVPDPGFFIWGDEREYRRRIDAAGFKVVTNCSASATHPGIAKFRRYVLGMPMMPALAPWKKYYEVRNGLYILSRYDKIKLALSPLVILREVFVAVAFSHDKLLRLRNISLGVAHFLLGVRGRCDRVMPPS